jgi:hypothetical protein
MGAIDACPAHHSQLRGEAPMKLQTLAVFMFVCGGALAGCVAPGDTDQDALEQSGHWRDWQVGE